jgi:hypothetical protein
MRNQDICGDVPAAVWEGCFRLFGVNVRCAVLGDGRRVIEKDSMEALLAAMANGATDAGDMEAFSRWQRGESMGGTP